MAGYSKLFSSLVTSSVWCECHTTRIVWITMLALSDAKGFVEGSIPGLAHQAQVTIPEAENALDRLSSPDPYSRTPDYEGRRIEVVRGGWVILNYPEYRNRLQEKEGSKAKAMRESRERKRNGNALPGVTNSGANVTLPASAYPGMGDVVQKDGTTEGDWAPPLERGGV